MHASKEVNGTKALSKFSVKAEGYTACESSSTAVLVELKNKNNLYKTIQKKTALRSIGVPEYDKLLKLHK